MKKLTLVIPEKKYLDSYLSLCEENAQHNLPPDFLTRDPKLFNEWKENLFDSYRDRREGIDLPEGFVPETIFWTVEDDQVLGVGAIRHWLSPTLERFGGHIGYCIRPSLWSKGYGSEQLKRLLDKAKEMGISVALTTCNDQNIGSYRVMEKNGGVMKDKIENIIDGKNILTRRYEFLLI